MSGGPWLIPNVGGEEESRGRAAPAVATVTRLWHLLFSSATRMLDDEDALVPVWPGALGPRAQDPAFPWLADERKTYAWLGNDAAARAAEAAGHPLAGPASDVVRGVHDKAFAHSVGEEAGLVPASLRGLVAVLDPSELRDADAAVRRVEHAVRDWPSWTRGRFALKPRIGASGRGRVAGSHDRIDTPELRGALPRLARQGGALLEPWLTRLADSSVQLYIAPDGALTLLGMLEQHVSSAGSFRGHSGAVDYKARIVSECGEENALIEAALEVARAAHARGFFGPCGIDAFRFEGPQGAELRPAVEFNARFTMGTISIGLLHRARARIAAHLELTPGERRHFFFGLDAPAAGWPEADDAALLMLPLWGPRETLRPALVLARDREALNALLDPQQSGV